MTTESYVPKTVWATPTGRPLNYPEPGGGVICTRGSRRTRSARSAVKTAVTVASASSTAGLAHAAIAR